MKKILSLFMILAIVFAFSSCGGEKIVWKDLILGEELPEPPSDKGKIYSSTSEEIWVDIEDISDKQYTDYIEACKKKGFTVDSKSNSLSYIAYNTTGYKLELTHYSGDTNMSIQLEAPMELSEIKWPTGTAGKLLPVPKSMIGKFSYEHDDSFFLYIGDSTKSDYNDYVTACSEKGFNVDYDKGDDYYFAKNSDGWSISLRYQGNNIMSIDIDSPSDEETSSKVTSSAEESKLDVTDNESKTEDNKTNDSIDPDFKAAMDSYEKFMDEYVAFMKKYNANPSDLSLISDYADYLSEYADFVEDFEKWEDEELNTAETEYYIDVQARVNKKLLESAQ